MKEPSLVKYVKPHIPGTINPCGRAAITSEKGVILAWCLDTPNAIAFAFSCLPNATHAVAYYPGFAPTETKRAEYAERIEAKGYGMTAKKAFFELSP